MRNVKQTGMLAGIMQLALMIAPVFSACVPGSSSGGAPTEEALVKAGIVFNLARVVTWPEAGEGAPLFGIGLAGHDAADPALATLVGKEIRGRGLFICESPPGNPQPECQIVYVSLSESRRLQEILAAYSGRPILTVSEIEGFCAKGGMVQLLRSGNRLALRVNRAAALGAGLRPSSQLLKVAELVETES